jgi:hypothetical protein
MICEVAKDEIAFSNVNYVPIVVKILIPKACIGPPPIQKQISRIIKDEKEHAAEIKQFMRS